MNCTAWDGYLEILGPCKEHSERAPCYQYFSGKLTELHPILVQGFEIIARKRSFERSWVRCPQSRSRKEEECFMLGVATQIRKLTDQ